MAYDGTIRFDTSLDSTGVVNGLSKVGKVGVDALKATTTAALAATAAFAGITAAAVKSYADTEQLVGGIKTLFGTEANSVNEYAESVGKTVDEVSTDYKRLVSAQDIVLQNADNAFKTAGLSANEYMETVTSFSAALIASMSGDTEAAAQKADQALTDMSDNANKMGTDMGAIQYAYQGFAKQNYTMLDNLKLGYGGTKTEMERLLADASEISGIQYDISSYADVIDAIHTIQTQMGITGTTAREASQTISGSINMMKAAYQNFLSGAAGPTKNVDALVDNLVESVKTVADNIVPVVQNTIPKIIDGLSQIGSAAIEYIPGMLNSILPGLQAGAGQLIGAVINILPDLISTAVEQLPSLVEILIPILIDGIDGLVSSISEAAPALAEMAIQLVTGLADAIAEQAPILIPTVVETMLTIVDAIVSNVDLLIDAAVAIVEGLAEGLVNSIPVFIERAPEIMIKIAGALIDAFLAISYEIPLTICNTISDSLTNFNWDDVADESMNRLADSYGRAVDNCTDRLIKIAEKWNLLLNPNAAQEKENEQKFDEMVDRYSVYTKTQLKNMFNDMNTEISDLNSRFNSLDVISADAMAGLDVTTDFEAWKKANADILKDYKGDESLDGYLNYMNSAIEEAKAKQSAMGVARNTARDIITQSNQDGAKLQADSEMQKSIATQKYVDDRLATLRSEQTGMAEIQQENIDTTQALKDAWEQINHDYNTGVISSEQELYEQKAAAFAKYGSKSEKEHWKYYEDLISMQNESSESNVKAVRDNLAEQSKVIESGLNDIYSKYKDRYNDIYSNIASYKQKMLGIGDVFTVKTEELDNGKTKKTYSVEDIQQQIDQMKAYNADIENLKKRGADSSMIDELMGMGYEDGSQFADNLSNMSAKEFNKLNELYVQRNLQANQMAKDAYKDELDGLQTDFISEVQKVFAQMPQAIGQAGSDSVTAFINAFEMDDKSFATLGAMTGQFFTAYNESIKQANFSGMITDSLNIDTYAIGKSLGEQFMLGFSETTKGYTFNVMQGATATQQTGSTAGQANSAANGKVNVTVNTTNQTIVDGKVVQETTNKYNTISDRGAGR